jgi:hypothetical protein
MFNFEKLETWQKAIGFADQPVKNALSRVATGKKTQLFLKMIIHGSSTFIVHKLASKHSASRGATAEISPAQCAGLISKVAPRPSLFDPLRTSRNLIYFEPPGRLLLIKQAATPPPRNRAKCPAACAVPS